MKFIFVTGGVVSGIGKGITAASIGRLLKSAGYNIKMIKMDPYLQVDAGTMSPYEHGEVFVTEDGAETDLDIGHYERFINTELTGDCSITSGKIYWTVIQKERKGDYLGKTVQVIPHLTDEIKSRMKKIAKNTDITIVEVGGTIGDIEAHHFIESIRQMKKDVGAENVLYVHVAPLIYLQTSGEIKTKPIQHSVKELRESGIQADILICRTDVKMNKSIKDKISLLCDVENECVIEGSNAKTIYEVPLLYKKQKLDSIIQKKLGLKYEESSLQNWSLNVDKLLNPKKKVTIGVIGKYAQFKDAYLSLIESLDHAGANNGAKVTINWIQSDDLEGDNYEEILKDLQSKGQLDGILIPGGFGGRGVEGKINAVKFAREHRVPFLGICMGLQVAVIEFARNICKLKGADSTEINESTKYPVIDYIPEQRTISDKGGTMRLGAYPAILKKGSLAEKLYGAEKISERHRHRYEVNPDYHEILEKSGLVISGISPNKKLVEFIELKDHPYFIATQAHPEFKSRLNHVHPLFDGLIKNSINIQEKRTK